MDWVLIQQWLMQWTLESPYLSVFLLLIVLTGLKTTVVRVFGKRPVIEKPNLTASEAIAWLQANRSMSGADATRQIERQATQLEIEQQRRVPEATPEEDEGERRSAWDRLKD